MPKRKSAFNTWFKSAPIMLLYGLVVLLISIGVLLFSLLYSGRGANVLATPTDLQPVVTAVNVLPIEIDASNQTPATAAPTIKRTGRFIPYLENGLWGYKNTDGAVVIQPRFSLAKEFEGDIAFAAQDGLYGLISRSGSFVYMPTWSNVQSFSNGWAGVEKDGKWGFIDESGELVIDYIYREVGPYACGRAMVRSASSYAYIDALGNIAVSAKWREANPFSEDMAFVTSDEYEKDRHYIIDKVGNKIATLGSQDKGSIFSEGFAAIISSGGCYYINTSGAVQFGRTFDDARSFSGGYAAVRQDGLWGYIDDSGEFEIKPQFADASGFSGSYAAVKSSESGLWGYINADGIYVLPPEYESAGAFSDGVAVVAKDGSHYIVNVSGELIPLY